MHHWIRRRVLQHHQRIRGQPVRRCHRLNHCRAKARSRSAWCAVSTREPAMPRAPERAPPVAKSRCTDWLNSQLDWASVMAEPGVVVDRGLFGVLGRSGAPACRAPAGWRARIHLAAGRHQVPGKSAWPTMIGGSEPVTGAATGVHQTIQALGGGFFDAVARGGCWSCWRGSVQRSEARRSACCRMSFPAGPAPLLKAGGARAVDPVKNGLVSPLTPGAGWRETSSGAPDPTQDHRGKTLAYP